MLKAQDIMMREVVTISGSATVAEAIALMQEKKLHTLIVDRRSEADPYGIITETDIVYKVTAYGLDPKNLRVYQIMTKPCIVVNPELGVEYVARLFANTKIHQAPVIKGSLLGLISISDILTKGNVVEKPRRLYIDDEIEAARDEARSICLEKGKTSPECAAAWDIVEELQAEASHRRAGSSPSGKTAFELYCEDNPDAPESRMYED